MNINSSHFGVPVKPTAKTLTDERSHLGDVALILGDTRIYLSIEEASAIVVELAGAVAKAKAEHALRHDRSLG